MARFRQLFDANERHLPTPECGRPMKEYFLSNHLGNENVARACQKAKTLELVEVDQRPRIANND
jgi:hypothetical protein